MNYVSCSRNILFFCFEIGLEHSLTSTPRHAIFMAIHFQFALSYPTESCEFFPTESVEKEILIFPILPIYFNV